MPINYAHIQNTLDHYAELTRKKLDEATESFSRANAQLEIAAQHQEAVLNAIEHAEAEPGNLYTAKPSHEALLSSFPLPDYPKDYTLIAADGSQINPSRHRALQFCLINVGLIHVEHGSGEAPSQQVFSKLLDHDELYTNDGRLIGEDEVALHRDLFERQFLMEALPASIQKPTITLTDGPLEVFSGAPFSGDRRQRILDQKITIEKRMKNLGVINAGYIDKPGAEMVNRMLDIYHQNRDSANTKYDSKKRANKGVSDLALFQKRLAPGERSSVFYAINKSEEKPEGNDVGFFLLNVSDELENPWLARVEFPAWMANDTAKINILHAILYRDAQVLNPTPYPYVLHRAHELAIVMMAEHDEVEEMLISRLNRDNIPLGTMSHKQSLKFLPKR